MTYYDDTIRKRITEQLKGYRSMLEQTLISASDQNLHLLANERIKQLDELLKILKPSPFDFLTKKEIRKIQESRYLQQKEAELKQQFEEKLQTAQNEIRAEIESEYQKRRNEKKKRKKTKREVEELLPELLRNLQANSKTEFSGKAAVTEKTAESKNAEPEKTAVSDKDDFPDISPDNIN